MNNAQLRRDLEIVNEAARAYADDLVGRSHTDHNIGVADRIIEAAARLETHAVSKTHGD